MMAANKKIAEAAPGDIEALLPWYAAGTLNARDTRRVEEALARDSALAKQYAVIRDEYAETISLNESLGAPSARAMQKLFAAIDAEPARHVTMSRGLSARISQFFADLSPRTLAATGAVGALVVVLQAGVIAAMLAKDDGSHSFQTASHRTENAPLTRGLATEPGPQALVRFAPDARMSDISTLLDAYQATIVSVSRSGLFLLRFDGRAIKDAGDLISRLQSEKIVNLAVPAQ
jgi:anti-sigma factor RsiW